MPVKLDEAAVKLCKCTFSRKTSILKSRGASLLHKKDDLDNPWCPDDGDCEGGNDDIDGFSEIRKGVRIILLQHLPLSIIWDWIIWKGCEAQL